MIVYADDVLKEEVKNIWKICFPDDSDDFVNFYFDTKYKNENTLVYLENGVPAACLQMLPYDLTYYNHRIPTAYISGAATLPNFRKKGIMKKLLVYAYHEMEKKNIPLSTLIPQEPWLIDFYENLGYETIFEYSDQILQSPTAYDTSFGYEIISVSCANNNVEAVYNFYSAYLATQNLCIQKNLDDFKAIVTFYELEEGEIVLAYKEKVICGLCFVTQQNKTSIVKDFIFDSQLCKKTLLYHILKKYPNNEIIIRNPCEENTKCYSKGMLRVINPEFMLNLYAKTHPETTFSFSLSDNQMPANNSIYQLENGICKKPHTISKNNELNIDKIDINLLSRLLFGYKLSEVRADFHFFQSGHPYMSLLLD